LGLLRDIKNGPNQPLRGLVAGGAVVFWAIVGGALGFGLANFASLPTGATTVAACVGFGVGISLGFYAGFGTSDLARVLALPGAIVELLL
jgi:hypothetical protein